MCATLAASDGRIVSDVPNIGELEHLLRSFIAGPDRSIARANEIEVACDPFVEADDEWFADFRIALASYRPEGGEYLWGEADMLRLCKDALAELQRHRT